MIQIIAMAGSLLAACIWGLAFVVMKDGLNQVSAAYMIAIRFTVAAIIIGLVFIKRLNKINLSYIKKASLIGLFVFFAYLFQTIGCNYTSPGKNAFLSTAFVILLPLYSWLVLRKRPSVFVFAAVVLQMLGIALLSLGHDITEGIKFSLGDWLTLLCAFFYCLQMFYQSYYSKNSQEDDPFVYAFVQFVAAAILSWITALFYDGQNNCLTLNLQLLSVSDLCSRGFLLSLVYLGVFSTAVALVLQNIGLKYLKPSLATILLSFESVFGMLFSILIPVNGVRESITVWGLVGCAMMVLAVILAQKD